MKKNAIEIILAVVIILGCLFIGKQYENGLSNNGGLNRYAASFFEVFDTQAQIVGYAKNEEEFTAQVEKLKEKLTYYHELYDIYNCYDVINNIKTINDHAGIAPVVVDEEIINLLKMSKDMFERTGGKVNVAMGSVLSIWHTYREKGVADPENAELPDMQELENAADSMDLNHLIIDEEASTVYLEDAEMSLDVGGIGKGYAVQKVAEYAKELGMDNLLLSVGGNVCAVGAKYDGTNWNIGIVNPIMGEQEAYSAKVSVKDCSVVTSGNYQRYYTVDGVRYCHIINPDTLMPADNFASLSIVAKDSGIADALSTAVYNMSFDEGIQFVNEMENVEAMWIMEDGSISYSEGFKTFLSEE